MIEHERSYVFTLNGINRFVDKHNIKFDETKEKILTELYLEHDLRIRHIEIPSVGKNVYMLTRKEGDKAKGYRIENECEISEKAAKLLMCRGNLKVQKTRKQVVGDEYYDITIDYFSSPMSVAILEIESLKEVVFPIPGDITSKLFGTELRECPLSTYNLFKRRIGICGGPSSGKSEAAKILSHNINTSFKGNSFHVTEFATSFIQKYNRNPQFLDQFFVWYGQRERENDAYKSNIVISDCPTFLSYIYMLKMKKFDFSAQSAFALSKIYKRVLFDLQRYTDIIFLNIQEYQENNIRYQSLEEAKQIEGRIAQFLEDHQVPHIRTDYNNYENILNDLFYINE
jgi:nicotinamide riboside kinase